MYRNFHLLSQQSHWYSDPQWWAIVTALFLGLLGMFQGWIRELIFKPNIQPVESKITSQYIGTQHYLYYRFIIKNSRKGLFSWLPWFRIQAKGARVLLTYRNPPDNFIPIPLNWTHFNSLERNIPPDEEVYIDILRQKTGDDNYEFCWPGVMGSTDPDLKYLNSQAGDIRLEFFDQNQSIGDIHLKFDKLQGFKYVPDGSKII